MTFTYASDGCLATKSDSTDMWTYEWDYERRLAAFRKNVATLVEYGYNPTGTRRQASDATLGVENYFHSRGHVLADYNFNWTLEKSYILGPRVDEIIAMIDRTTDPNVSYYFMRDRLDSTRELVNTSETINTRYDYDVWGDPTESQLSGNVSTRHLCAGLTWDGRALYLRKPPWSPELGRAIASSDFLAKEQVQFQRSRYAIGDIWSVCDDAYWRCWNACDENCFNDKGWCQACCGYRLRVCENSHGRLQNKGWSRPCYQDCCQPWASPIDDPDDSPSTCEWSFERSSECWCFLDGVLWAGYYNGRYCKYCIYTCYDLVSGNPRDDKSSVIVTFHIADAQGVCPAIVHCSHKKDECTTSWTGYPLMKIFGEFIWRYLLG